MKNIAYQMFALIAEISSIFLHARKLSYLYHFPRENSSRSFEYLSKPYRFFSLSSLYDSLRYNLRLS